MIARATEWLATRTARERALLAIAAGAAVALLALVGAFALRDDFATLHARVAAHERDLARARMLARRLAASRSATPAVAPDTGGSLVAELQAAADAVVGRDRIAGMTPAAATTDDGVREERVVLRIAGAPLADCVRLLHGLEVPGRRVARLELRKHPDEPARFDATIDVARLRPAS